MWRDEESLCVQCVAEELMDPEKFENHCPRRQLVIVMAVRASNPAYSHVINMNMEGVWIGNRVYCTRAHTLNS
jgi:hypothetical protein